MRTTTVVTLIAAAFLMCPTAKADTMGLMTITTDTVLTENHIGEILMAADDITLDCAEHTITGPAGFGAGVVNDTHNGNTIKNCHVTGFVRCFLVQFSSHIMLTDNSATDCEVGFDLGNVEHTILRNSTAISNKSGINLGLSSNSHLFGNEIDQSVEVGIALVKADLNKLIDNTVVRGQHLGIKIRNSDKNNLKLNTACGNGLAGTGAADAALQVGSDDNNLHNNDFCITAGF